MERISQGLLPFHTRGLLLGAALFLALSRPAWGQALSPPVPTPDDDPVAAELEFHRGLFLSSPAPSLNTEIPFEAGEDSRGVEPCAVPCASHLENRIWNLTVLVASEYDDNLAAAPRFEGLGAVKNRDDGRFVAALFGDIEPLRGENWGAGAMFSTFHGFQYEQNAFDLEDYMGGAFAHGAWGDWLGSVRYEYHNTGLGHDHLADDHRLTPSLSFLGFDWGHTTVYYEHDSALLNAPALIPAQIQSGDVNAVGATQAVYTFEGVGRVYAGYRFENADADGSDFSRRTNMATARLEQPLWARWFFDIEARHFWDDYKHPNSLDFWDRPRFDRRWEVRSGIQNNLTQQWTIRFDYTHLANSSNVENLFGVRFFEYQRNLFSTQMIYAF